MSDKDWHKIVKDLQGKVDDITRKNPIPDTQPIKSELKMISYNIDNYSNNDSKSIFKNIKIMLSSIFGGTFILVCIILFATKPGFLIIKIRNEKTFFIDEFFNFKLMSGLAFMSALALSYAYYHFFLRVISSA